VRRITGTHVYGYAKCPRLAALDLHLDRSERRPPAPWEEWALRTGREFEAACVRDLGAISPVHPERDFAAGAAATLALLRAGTPLVHQGVLRTDDRLGLPDLLRAVPGRSALGEHHYEVVDVKTSGRPRSDQILQVVFYSRLLAAVQDRAPEHGALLLKDRREERFLVADFEAAAIEVERELQRLHDDAGAARAFLQPYCASCHWNHRCLPQLAASQDLSLVQGMTAGARAILEGLGCRTVADLAAFAGEGSRARGHLDPVLLRRLRRAAQATLLGRPLPEARPRVAPLEPAALVHLLVDPYAERVLLFALLEPADPAGRFRCVPAARAEDEWQAWHELLAGVPRESHLLHFGDQLPQWYEQQAFAREAEVGQAGRFVELGRRLRGAAAFPGPVFSLADLVARGLGRDPLRAGHPGLCAAWAAAADGGQKLVAKARADLEDLALLKQRFLDEPQAAREATVGPDAGATTA
jgi:predicted RecB family nuclease